MIKSIKLILVCLPLVMVTGLLHAQQGDSPAQKKKTIRFAVIGDFGSDNKDEQAVADLIDSWNVDFIISTGDNYYRTALGYGGNGFNQFDNSVGKYYCQYLKDTGLPDTGDLDCAPEQQSQTINRFFPTIGNHDRHDTQSASIAEYLGYFTLPGDGFENSSGNERYYDFAQGPVHFFAIDSDTARRDDEDLDAQKAWLKKQLQASASPWNVVYFHQSAYSSAFHGSDPVMQWPFSEWGADVVFQGHDHVYERILRDDIAYFVSGNGGRRLYEFATAIGGSVVRYDTGFGAMLVEVDEATMELESWAVNDEHRSKDDSTPLLIDYYHLPAVQEGCTTANVPIRTSTDDAVQDQASGRMDLSTTDLAMVDSGDGPQYVGLRFDNVVIPADTVIHDAVIEFTARSYETSQTNLLFYGQAADNAESFTPGYEDISARPRTAAQVEWNDIADWYRISPRATYLSPDLSSIVQEIITRDGWTSGNALAFMIDGSGHRTAYAYDHNGQDPSLLSILYCETADIGDEIWVDFDEDGLHSPGENQRAGVTVKLWNAGADGEAGGDDDLLVSTTMSGNQGYGFYDLDPGSYYVEFVRPSRFHFAQRNAGQDGERDSDADSDSGFSQIIAFSGTPVRDIDAGLVPAPPNIEAATSDSFAQSFDVFIPWLLVVLLSLVIVFMLIYIFRKRHTLD